MVFPLALDLGAYTVRAAQRQEGVGTKRKKEGKEDRDREEDDGGKVVEARYGLSSVVVHKGKMDSGHYVNYAREGQEWFMFDDAKVTMVGEREVLGAEAYLLFYVAQEV